MKILVSDGEQRSALAVTRSLGRGGHQVFVTSSSGRSLAGASRHCRGEVRVDLRAGEPDQVLQEAVDRLGIQGYLPMTDGSAEVGLRLREARPGVQVLFPDARAYREISDKRLLTEVARGLGIPVPEQVVLHEPPGEVGEVLERLPLPLVAKPARSAVRVQGGVRQFGVSMVDDEAALRRALAHYPPEAYPLLLQRRITGPGLGAFALFWEGRPVRWFAHRRIREKPPTGGVSVYRESVPLREEIREYSERLLEHFRWSGVAMVEFKEDADTGVPYLMEVNGRFWGSLQLALDAGVDFPLDLVSLTSGQTLPPATPYRTGIRTRWLLGDLDHLLWMLRSSAEARRGHPELPSRMGALARFLVPWRPGDRFEVLSPTDPRPFLREVGQWLASLRR